MTQYIESREMELSAEWPECSVNVKEAKTARWGSGLIPSHGSFFTEGCAVKRPLLGFKVVVGIPGTSLGLWNPWILES